MSDSDNPFAPLSREEMAMLTAAEEAGGGIDEIEFTMAGLTEEPATELAVADTVEPSRRVVKRRIVRQVDLKHVAQDMIGHGIANVLGYWFEDATNRKKLEELGITREEFAPVLLKQADRAAKALGFEQAWQN